MNRDSDFLLNASVLGFFLDQGDHRELDLRNWKTKGLHLVYVCILGACCFYLEL